MNDAKHGIEFVAINLTKEQFKGYCLGMELMYMRRALNKTDATHAGKSMAWWRGAYEKCKDKCKG